MSQEPMTRAGTATMPARLDTFVSVRKVTGWSKLM